MINWTLSSELYEIYNLSDTGFGYNTCLVWFKPYKPSSENPEKEIVLVSLTRDPSVANAETIAKPFLIARTRPNWSMVAILSGEIDQTKDLFLAFWGKIVTSNCNSVVGATSVKLLLG